MKLKMIMEYLVENWYWIVGLVALVAVVVCMVFRFLGMPTAKQKKKVREWMIWACIKAEKNLQSEKGKLKLREVYDMFCAVPAFKWVAIIISFEKFEEWLDDALVEAKKMLVSNMTLAEYVYGKDKAATEVEKIRKQIGG